MYPGLLAVKIQVIKSTNLYIPLISWKRLGLLYSFQANGMVEINYIDGFRILYQPEW